MSLVEIVLFAVFLGFAMIGAGFCIVIGQALPMFLLLAGCWALALMDYLGYFEGEKDDGCR